MKSSIKNTVATLFIVALFAIAMGYFESVVVYYLKMIVGPEVLPLASMQPPLLFVEQTREVATMVMLVTFAFLIGKSKIEKILFFLYAFAVWDIFYYVSLYLLFGWPTSFTTIDILFNIPSREFWFSPVFVPILISSATIVVTSFLLTKKPKRLFK